MTCVTTVPAQKRTCALEMTKTLRAASAVFLAAAISMMPMLAFADPLFQVYESALANGGGSLDGTALDVDMNGLALSTYSNSYSGSWLATGSCGPVPCLPPAPQAQLSSSWDVSTWATLGALHTSADASAGFDLVALDGGGVMATAQAGATAGFDDLIFVTSKKKPDGTPYLPDGTPVTLSVLFLLQSFETATPGINTSAFSSLIGQLGGAEGPAGAALQTSSNHAVVTEFLVTSPAVIGAALPISETLESTASAAADLADTFNRASANAFDTGTLMITLDNPFATYTTASGVIYPSDIPAEFRVPEPSALMLLGTGLFGIGLLRRKRA
jgi:hypothetical protein